MKQILWILPCILQIISCSNAFRDESIKQLDSVIESREELKQQFDSEADVLRSCFYNADNDSLKWVHAAELFELNKYANLDSARVWLAAMERYGTSHLQKILGYLGQAHILYSARNYYDAQNILDAIDISTLDQVEQKEYYHSMSSFCSAAFNEDGLGIEKRAKYIELRRRCFQNILDLDILTEGERLYYTGRISQYKGDYNVALGYLLQSCECEHSWDMRIHTLYAIANCYKSLGDRGNWKNYLAKTAILDQKLCYRQYKSLYDLALCLYEEGDYKRADKYISITLSDAITSGYGTRIVTANEAGMIISSASAQRNLRIRTLLVLLLFIAAASMIIIFMYSRKLENINNRLIEANTRLREADKIKDNYLFYYMKQSSSYIKDMDDYRRELMRVIKQDGPEKVKSILRQPDLTYMKYENFYKDFDEIFLKIYPRFIVEINSLLKPEYRFDEGLHTLSTELRILAVIKLGMTESGKIASFLNMSSNTIYTYRVKMKHWSILPREEFENAVILLSMD